MRTFFFILGGLGLAVVAILAGMIAFGTSAAPPKLASISDPFRSVDLRDLPQLETIASRDGSKIAFRRYRGVPRPGEPERAVIAIHGSSASSSSLHPLAKALRAEGFSVYVPDIRGHGATGRRGDIDHRGQLDDDLADLIAAVRERDPQARLVLMGFSSGGGFALHAAGSPLGAKFERAVLLSPMLGVGSPIVQTSGDAWVKPFVPRILALMVLDRIGIHAFEGLPALAFAIAPEQADLLTGTYSFRLMRAFTTRDYATDLRSAKLPLAVVVGESDELFAAKLFAPTVQAIRPDVPVTIVPELNHIRLTTDPRGVPAIVAAIRGAS